MPFDNFFAYSLAGGTAIAPSDNGGGSTDTGSADGLVAYWKMEEDGTANSEV